MSMNESYQPINCDEYDCLELACMHLLILTLTLKDGEVLQAKEKDLILRKNVVYLLAEVSGESCELRVVKI
ncbi:Rho-binding antiterminator, partial [Salmonella enterica subsp. enterica serovar Infantis]